MDSENARSQAKVRMKITIHAYSSDRSLSCSVFLATTSTALQILCFNLIFITFANATYISFLKVSVR